jgi:hypothetical protein
MLVLIESVNKAMGKFEISVVKGKETYQFEVRDYLHHEDEQCKFEIYQDGEFVVSLEPDKYETLRVCKNTGKIDNKVVHLIVDKLETYHIH